VAAAGASEFAPPLAKNRRDLEQWSSLGQWVEKK